MASSRQDILGNTLRDVLMAFPSEASVHPEMRSQGCKDLYISHTGDMSDPKIKAGKEGAFKKSAAFFKKHL